MNISNDDIEELKQIHFEKTGKVLTNEEALEMAIRLTDLLKIIGKTPPQNNQELDERTENL